MHDGGGGGPTEPHIANPKSYMSLKFYTKEREEGEGEGRDSPLPLWRGERSGKGEINFIEHSETTVWHEYSIAFYIQSSVK